MENTRHLKTFQVNNFKCFDSIGLEDIGKVNLILGDNNSGKTSLLESLSIDENPNSYLRNLLGMVEYRNFIPAMEWAKTNYLNFYLSNKDDINEINYNYSYLNNDKYDVKVTPKTKNELTQEELNKFVASNLVINNRIPNFLTSIKINGEENIYSLNPLDHNIQVENNYMPFIKAGLMYHNDLVKFYSEKITENKTLKEDFIKALSTFTPSIYDIVIDTTLIPSFPTLKILFDNSDKTLPLFMLGDGTIRMVRIILEILISSNYRLMIDEIDNGFHFSKMKVVWSTILNTAFKNNTQLFITTHSYECLKYLKEVLEENCKDFQEEVRVYSLIKDKNNKTIPIKYNFSQFEHALDFNINIRGGGFGA